MYYVRGNNYHVLRWQIHTSEERERERNSYCIPGCGQMAPGRERERDWLVPVKLTPSDFIAFALTSEEREQKYNWSTHVIHPPFDD